jgi:hypothetical protein
MDRISGELLASHLMLIGCHGLLSVLAVRLAGIEGTAVLPSQGLTGSSA